ncbi:AAA family ATPase [Paracoccus sp. DMF-8]|uniref:AAA family ATPase n=1 Tax=Paracoccus sp. DMF-8 TaxID=3019445 RepID=UPI0023E3F7F0|nr:AAA family ATPase [Paracoccus sp. DMF-8]MDF3607940.1 AAA family ATPase [Paracoccus sp. DMF-8]
MSDHLFVVTGGPGSGKTSLISELASRGLHSMPESGRAIIQDQVRIGGPFLPWADKAMFAELMLGCDLRSWHEAAALKGHVLMDRGIPDGIGYLRLCGLPVPAHLEAAAKLYRYNRQVFIAPYWPEIFSQDAERKQDRQEAAATAKIMAETYARLGYQTIALPMTDLQGRADFVVDHLNRA